MGEGSTHCLESQDKLGFIDECLVKPEPKEREEFSEYHAWDMENSMICSWTLNIMKPKLRTSIAYAETAKDMRQDLQKRHGLANSPRIYQLRPCSSNLPTSINFNLHQPTSTHFMNFNKKIITSTHFNQLQSTSINFNQLLPSYQKKNSTHFNQLQPTSTHFNKKKYLLQPTSTHFYNLNQLHPFINPYFPTNRTGPKSRNR